MKRPRGRCPNYETYDAESAPACATEVYLACLSCVRRWQAGQAERIGRANKNPKPRTKRDKRER